MNLVTTAEISVSRAARIARCSNDTILRLIEQGAIDARRMSSRGWWKVDYESLIEYLNRNSSK